MIAIASTIALSGCATFENTDLVAKVGDVEMSSDELLSRARTIDEIQVAQGLPSGINGERVSGDLARNAISNWIGLQLADAADVVDAYLEGPLESGIACVYGIAAPDVATAAQWTDRLEGDTTWNELVAEVAPGTPLDGRAECFSTDAFGFADQLTDMSIDDPYRAVEFDDGSVILVRMQTVDEVIGFELLNAAQGTEPDLQTTIFAAADDTVIEVAPRYGAFDEASLGVRPLG